MKRVTQFLAVWGAALAFGGNAYANTITVQGIGEGQAISQNQIQSSGQVRLGQQDYSVTSVVTILSLVPGHGQTLTGETSHTMDFGSGNSITTMDKVQLVPVDQAGTYQLLIKCDVVSGTGVFANASGDLTFSGRVNLATGRAQWRLHGQLK